MKILKVKCDSCRKTADLWDDGTMLRTPKDWMTVWNEDKARNLDVHMCADCAKRLLKIKTPKPIKCNNPKAR